MSPKIILYSYYTGFGETETELNSIKYNFNIIRLWKPLVVTQSHVIVER